jgi:hypothetical protein
MALADPTLVSDRKARMHPLLKALPLALLAGAVLLVAGCGGDDTSSTGSADVQRFCEITAQLDREGTRIFKKVESSNEGHKVLLREQKAFLKRNQELLAEVQKVAPDELTDAVALEIAASKASAGEGPAVDQQQLSEGQAQVDAFRKENCKASGS